MCPIPLSPQRGRGPAPANDNLYDDASTVCSGNDIESTWSDDDYHSVERFPQYCRQDRAPRFRVKKDEASRQVYEAWNIFFFPERRELVRGTKVLGVKVENYDTLEPRVSRHIQPSEQSDLADVHLGAVRDFEEKHRRGWAGRIFRGKPKTYEQHLDERCGKLPLQVQHNINELLLDRGRASSTMYRTRTWSVASMKEQHAFRFAGTNYAEIKPQKKRFWNRKKTGPNGPLLYSVLIQGKETQACSSPDGIMTTSIWDNPWTNIDNTEARERSRERQRQRDLRRSKRFMSPPSYRSGRERSASPPSYRSSSYRSPRNRYDSPSSYRVRLDRLPIRNRSLSPVPLRNRNRSFSPVTLRTRNRSISPVPVRVRVQRRDRSPDSTTDTFPSPFNRDPFSVPTPPESYAPPPAVSAYSRPFFPPPPPPPAMNPAAPPAWGHFSGLPPPPSGPKFSIPPPFPRPACRACQTVPSCAHWAPTLPCPRPLQATNNGIPTHAPCIQCFPPRPAHQGSAYPSNVFANHYNNAPLVSFPPRPPPPPPGMMPISMPPPRPPFAPFTRPLWSHPQVTVSSPARYAHSLTSSDSESESESDTFFSRSSSPSSSSSKGTGWRKPKVEDHDDDLSDTATEIVDDGDAGPTEINAPATAGSGEGTAAEAEGDKAPDVVVPASEKK